MQSSSGTTRFLAVLLIGSIPFTSIVSAIPFPCPAPCCASSQAAHCCSDSKRKACCDHHNKVQKSCCQKVSYHNKCYARQLPEGSACQCHVKIPQPSAPRAPLQQEPHRPLLLLPSLDTVELFLKSTPLQLRLPGDRFSRALASTPLSILHCSWLI